MHPISSPCVSCIFWSEAVVNSPVQSWTWQPRRLRETSIRSRDCLSQRNGELVIRKLWIKEQILCTRDQPPDAERTICWWLIIFCHSFILWLHNVLQCLRERHRAALLKFARVRSNFDHKPLTFWRSSMGYLCALWFKRASLASQLSVSRGNEICKVTDRVLQRVLKRAPLNGYSGAIFRPFLWSLQLPHDLLQLALLRWERYSAIREVTLPHKFPDNGNLQL